MLPSRGCPNTPGQGHALSPRQVFGESVPCGDSLHTRAALAEETPLVQAQGEGGSVADTSLNLELDATLQKVP